MTDLITCPAPDCADVAEVEEYSVHPSTDGPVTHVWTQCLYRRHRFLMPADRLGVAS